MSRRDSRVHISVRQNDALLEFENFKKKFLFANKQITKQNCSLSLKIEELNAHISTLYVENLRLRASEISLQSQLKREREKCQKIMADAESATVDLLNHFGIIRQSYNIPTEKPTSPNYSESPLLQRRAPKSPTAPRLAQLPSVPDISEDTEPHETSSGENELAVYSPSQDHPCKGSNKPRSSISRLPVLSRVASPPPTGAITMIDTGNKERKKKLTRRASGLMVVHQDHPPRPHSPAFGSSVHRVMELSEEDQAAALDEEGSMGTNETERETEDETKKTKKDKRLKSENESDHDIHVERKIQNKKIDTKPSIKLKDVTNSPHRHPSFAVKKSIVDMHCDMEDAPKSIPLPEGSSEDRTYLPTPLPSSAATTPVTNNITLPATDAANGRERRMRKSVNYAEPKLNTKMRKPDSIPPPGARPSLTPIMTPVTTPVSTSSNATPFEDENQTDNAATAIKQRPIEAARRTAAAKKKRLSKPKVNSEEDGCIEGVDDDDDGADADAELSDFKGKWINVSGRRRSVQDNTLRDMDSNDYNTRKLEVDNGRRHSIAV